LNGKNLPSLKETNSTDINNVEEFERKLREENMRIELADISGQLIKPHSLSQSLPG
jgi:hypothetical protein